MKPLSKAKTSDKKKSTSIPKTTGKSTVAAQDVAVAPTTVVIRDAVAPHDAVMMQNTASSQPASATHTPVSISVSVIPHQPRHEEFSSMVARRAYELWQQGNCHHGNDMHHWLTAEKELSI